jgi:hypothetical protein
MTLHIVKHYIFFLNRKYGPAIDEDFFEKPLGNNY